MSLFLVSPLRKQRTTVSPAHGDLQRGVFTETQLPTEVQRARPTGHGAGLDGHSDWVKGESECGGKDTWSGSQRSLPNRHISSSFGHPDREATRFGISASCKGAEGRTFLCMEPFCWLPHFHPMTQLGRIRDTRKPASKSPSKSAGQEKMIPSRK
ncbi:unnamed protein product [Protopolystoma xenopodis]|uniref:Uncharacterized protein n=1 Tax=Protopolystoma xenopodis TaxID=117903 RepID=A0A3S5AAC8_9PLAT|nr:unnamed protein product [Protopolystoma xenopodis]